MSHNPVKSVTIIGGGTAGWMSAAALCSVLTSQNLKITLIESEAIGTVGVGEATLPHIRYFNQKLGIDEAELIKATQATFKLGIEFNDWGKLGDSYIHPFGNYGFEINRTGFHHYISRACIQNAQGWQNQIDTHLDAYSLPVMAARAGKFQPPHPDPKNILSTFGYAYQFDAGLYANFLRGFCEARGVTRIEGRVNDVSLRDEDGFIGSICLEDGRTIDGDIFIDCSGFRGLLISKALKTGYKDWTQYLPCDRAVTAGCEPVGPALPYTRATAKTAGWQWRIPLQNRIGNGYVYCSDYISDDEAAASLLADMDGAPHKDPKTLRFVTGQREKTWVKNCVAIGLSGGFLEPLESTGIFLIQEAITQFIERFPDKDCPQIIRDDYNSLMDLSFERVRDFLLLHYAATSRSDSPFWDRCREMELPDSLRYKMDLFKSSGRVVSYEVGAFKDPSWLAVYYGQGIVPRSYDPLVDHMPDALLPRQLGDVKASIARAVDTMPNHLHYIKENGLNA